MRAATLSRLAWVAPGWLSLTAVALAVESTSMPYFPVMSAITWRASVVTTSGSASLGTATCSVAGALGGCG